MKLNHANLCTSDLGRAASLFIDHFGFETFADVSNKLRVLRGDDGFILTLMTPGKMNAYPPAFHVGFLVDSPEAVRAKHAELDAAGWAPNKVGDIVRGGYPSTTFYCPLTDGILVEVSAPR